MIISTRIFLGAKDWTILYSIKLTTFYLITFKVFKTFKSCSVRSPKANTRRNNLFCVQICLLSGHSCKNANGRRKTRQTFSFIDFKDVISELALHAESKMIIFTSGLFIFSDDQRRQVCWLFFKRVFSFLFSILHEVGPFVLIMNCQPYRNKNPDLDFPNEMHPKFPRKSTAPWLGTCSLTRCQSANIVIS